MELMRKVFGGGLILAGHGFFLYAASIVDVRFGAGVMLFAVGALDCVSGLGCLLPSSETEAERK